MPKKEEVVGPLSLPPFGEAGWLIENICFPCWVLLYPDPEFKADMLAVLVSLSGGTKSSDIKECCISKSGMSVELKVDVPSVFLNPNTLSKMQPSYPATHPRTLAHTLAVRLAINKGSGFVGNKMTIPLPFKVEPDFFKDDGEAGVDVLIDDFKNMTIRDVNLSGSPLQGHKKSGLGWRSPMAYFGFGR